MTNILAVDDEPNNLMLIQAYLEDDGFEITTANDGAEAWQILTAAPEKFSMILLDRMMPNMNGMELTAKLRANESLSQIPIIMQTAAADPKQIQEGLQAGVYHYLTKPYDENTLRGIVQACLHDHRKKVVLSELVPSISPVSKLIRSCHVEFKSLEEAKDVAIYLASLFPAPEQVVMGISELLINAVEHGNLGIKYDQKTELNKTQTWTAEIRRLLFLPENRDKFVEVDYTNDSANKQIILHIKDKGEGFNWQQYMLLSPARATDNHGRGIAIAAALSFTKIEYFGNGNEVKCSLAIQ